MPKIQNYTAVHDDAPVAFRWEHDTREAMYVEVTQDDDDGYWRVRVWDYAHCTELGPISNDKTDMRSVAVDWMRDNPDGWTHDDGG